MKIRSIISILLVGGMMLSAMPSQAQEVKASQRFAGRATTTRVSYEKSGGNKLYHGIVLTAGGLVYSGDVITPGNMFKYGALGDNIGASIALNYKLTINVYVSMRFGLQYAYLQGSNKKMVDKVNYPFHEFKSSVIEPFVGVECYPILNYGFFVYGGFGVANSLYKNFTHQSSAEKPLYTTESTGDKVGVVPMFQFGLGYNWWLNQDWTLGVELMGQIGMCRDGKINVGEGTNYSIDGWPYKEAFTGNTEKKYDDAKRPDGWLQLGVVLSYHF